MQLQKRQVTLLPGQPPLRAKSQPRCGPAIWTPTVPRRVLAAALALPVAAGAAVDDALAAVGDLDPAERTGLVVLDAQDEARAPRQITRRLLLPMPRCGCGTLASPRRWDIPFMSMRGYKRLSTTEMEMVSWIMAQWERQENPEDPWVHCSLKGLADAFGVTWSGRRAAFTKEGLQRLHAVRFKAEVWNHREGKLKTELFGIFDRISIVERKDSYSARWSVGAGNAPVKIKIGDFLHQQLKLGQFHRYAWQVLRGKLQSPLAKRLYIFLDAQRGTETPAGWLYEVRVDEGLFASLGIRSQHLARPNPASRGV